MRVRRLLDPEVLEDRHALRGRDAPRDRADVGLGNAGDGAARRRPAIAANSSRRLVARPCASSRNARSTRSSSTSTARSAARHQASVPGLDLEVEVGELGRLGAARIDHDNARAGIVRDLLEHDAGTREAVRLPRVLADEHRHLGVLEVAAWCGTRAPKSWPSTQNSPVFSCASAFERVHAADRGAQRRAVAAAEVVPLPAAAVIEDRRRRRARRAPPRGARRPRRSRCPSRPARTCRRRGGASASSAGRARSGSGRAAAPSRTCSPATPGAPCRRGPVRSAGRRTAEADLDPAVDAAQDARRRNPAVLGSGHGKPRCPSRVSSTNEPYRNQTGMCHRATEPDHRDRSAAAVPEDDEAVGRAPSAAAKASA